MANILKTVCPSCRKMSSNPVLHPDRHLYKISSEADELLKDRFGMGIRCRAHIRECIKCGAEYETVEIAGKTIDHLITLLHETQEEAQTQKKALARMQAREDEMVSYLDHQLEQDLPVAEIKSVRQSLAAAEGILTESLVARLSGCGIQNVLDLILHPFDQLSAVHGPLVFDEARSLRELLRSMGLSVPPPVKIDFPTIDVDPLLTRVADERSRLLKYLSGHHESSPREKRKAAREIHQAHKQLSGEISECLVELFSHQLLGEKLFFAVKNAKTDEVVILPGRRITKTLIRKICSSIKHMEMPLCPAKQLIDHLQSGFAPVYNELETFYEEMMDAVEFNNVSPAAST